MNNHVVKIIVVEFRFVNNFVLDYIVAKNLVMYFVLEAHGSEDRG